MPGHSLASLTFGSHDDIATLVGRVSRVLDVEFELRDSLYHGGDYYLGRSNRGTFTVQHNREIDEPAEPERPDLPTLLYASIPIDDVPSVIQTMTLLQLEPLTHPTTNGNQQ